MLIALGTRGQSGQDIVRQADGMETGFQVPAQTMPPQYQNVYGTLMRAADAQPSENQVQNMAQRAGESQTGLQLYRDYLKHAGTVAANTVQMHVARNNYIGNLANQSGTLAKSQNQLTLNLAQVGYNMGQDNAFTRGSVNAYQRGYQRLSAGF